MNEKIIEIKRIIENINKSKKIAIYGAGEHTKNLFYYTDLWLKNLKVIADKKNGYKYDHIEVVDPETLRNCDCDVIIISSYEFQDEIYNYLINELGIRKTIIKLYDKNDEFPFYYDHIQDMELKKIIRHKEKMHDDFINIHFRPKYTESLKKHTYELKNKGKSALVIQGPAIKENDLTLNSIILYKKTFPNSYIIFSTWENQDEEYIEKIRSTGINILINKKPENNGRSNINLQIISTKEGINEARRLGAEYILKIRSDMRMYANTIIEYLINLINTFPIKHKYNQKQRLISVNIDSFKYRPYSISDMFMFGQIDDMTKYWSPDLLVDNKNSSIVQGKDSMREFMHVNTEAYFVTEFLKKIGKNIEWSLQDSLKTYAEHFCIVDQESLDLLWNKYDNKEYKFINYDCNRTNDELNFREWINLYCNVNNNIALNNSIIDARFGDEINQYFDESLV